MNFMLHRSSRGIIKIALPISSSRVGSVKRARFPNSRAGLLAHCLLGETFESRASGKFLKENLLLRCEYLGGMIVRIHLAFL